ncbi:MAG: DNA cytosine methyltransferase [Endomicrobium sp.]|nr:DNA cytosine methyltransferase [Endomicrobium sp.]
MYGERSGLWNEYYKIICNVRPPYIIAENSSMLLIRGFERVIADLSKIGYCIEWKTIRASDFGYPHKRERLFIIAYTSKMRCKNNIEESIFIPKILRQWTSRQVALPMPIKRYDSETNFDGLRINDGFAGKLDEDFKRRIECCGNAIVVDIAQALFECIQYFNERIDC